VSRLRPSPIHSAQSVALRVPACVWLYPQTRTRLTQLHQQDPSEACIPGRIPSLQKARCRSLGRYVDTPRFMELTALHPRPEPKATPCSTEWCEIAQHGPQANCCPVAQRNRVFPYSSASNHVSEQNSSRCCPRRPALTKGFGDGPVRN
jgi:hypothetical protein